jgi:ATP-binding cassette, subfamily B, bacterial PglK
LSGKVTVVVVAHRLSTIRNVDQLIYLEKGKILGVGNFEELKSRVPNFNNQTELMGLN